MKHPLTLLAAIPIGFLGSTNVSAQDLQALLECRSETALTSGIETLMHNRRVGSYDCRTHELDRQVTVYCTGSGNATAFGHSVREFNLVREPDGATVLSVAFRAGPSRLEHALKQAQSMASGPAPIATANVEPREDGVAELRCVVPGSGGNRGAIAGSLDFRGMQPIPPMRVCAAPVRDTRRPYCVETADGQLEYRIENLPTGDYYVTAFPLQNNPHRLIGVYSRPMKTCSSTDAYGRCENQHLQQVTVFSGDVRQGINPDAWLADVPLSLQTYAFESGTR